MWPNVAHSAHLCKAKLLSCSTDSLTLSDRMQCGRYRLRTFLRLCRGTMAEAGSALLALPIACPKGVGTEALGMESCAVVRPLSALTRAGAGAGADVAAPCSLSPGCLLMPAVAAPLRGRRAPALRAGCRCPLTRDAGFLRPHCSPIHS